MKEPVNFFIPINKYSRPGKKLLIDKPYVVWHYPEAPGWNARRMRKYAAEETITEKRYAGWHVCIGDDGVIIIVPLDERAFHVGKEGLSDYTDFVQKEFGDHASKFTIGIECSHIDTDGRYSEKTYKNMVDFGVWLCKKYKFSPLKYFKRHYDMTYKPCPLWFVKQPNEWQRFLDDVTLKLAAELKDHEIKNYLIGVEV